MTIKRTSYLVVSLFIMLGLVLSGCGGSLQASGEGGLGLGLGGSGQSSSGQISNQTLLIVALVILGVAVAAVIGRGG